MNSGPWLQQISMRLASNGFQPMSPDTYQPQGFKYVAHRSRFEPSKFGMAERFFTFAEIQNLEPQVLQQYSGTSFQFACKNKSAPIPNGFFMSVFCFAVVITEGLHPQFAQMIRDTAPIKHWAAFEMPVVHDLANGGLYYFEKTPLWGAAYYAGFRREVQTNLG